MNIEHLMLIAAILWVGKLIWDTDTEHAAILAGMKRHGFDHAPRQYRGRK